jgi:hypothetical protein
MSREQTQQAKMRKQKPKRVKKFYWRGTFGILVHIIVDLEWFDAIQS